MIRDRYRYQLFLDKLPNSTLLRDKETNELSVEYKDGIFIGEHNKEDTSIILYNHLDFTVKVQHVHGGDEVRIVGFEVEQFSIKEGSSLDPNYLTLQPKQYLRRPNG